MTERGEPRRCVTTTSENGRLDRGVAEPFDKQNSERLRFPLRRASSLLRQSLEHQPGIGCRSGDWSHHLAIEHQLRKTAAATDAARRRLQSHQSGMRCRPADGAAPIGSKRKRDQARRYRRNRAAARTARCPCGIPRIARNPINRIRCVAAQRELRHIGFTEQNRARIAQTGDRQFVMLWHMTGIET